MVSEKLAKKHDAQRRWRLEVSIAVVAALSGLVGASVGGFTTYLTTNRQIDAQVETAKFQAQRGQIEYLREQRRTVYANLLDIDSDLADAEHKNVNLIDRSYNRDGLKLELHDAYVLRDKLEKATVQVQIIGSPSVRKEATGFLDQHTEVLSSQYSAGFEKSGNGGYNRVQTALIDIVGARDDFIAAVRKELGAELR